MPDTATPPSRRGCRSGGQHAHDAYEPCGMRVAGHICSDWSDQYRYGE